MLKITLKAARVNANYSVQEVAKYMNKCVNTIFDWESGKTPLKILDFDKLCNLYGVSRDNIIIPTTLQNVDKINDSTHEDN